MTTFHPAPASLDAVAFPIPELAPVTKLSLLLTRPKNADLVFELN